MRTLSITNRINSTLHLFPMPTKADELRGVIFTLENRLKAEKSLVRKANSNFLLYPTSKNYEAQRSANISYQVVWDDLQEAKSNLRDHLRNS